MQQRELDIETNKHMNIQSGTNKIFKSNPRDDNTRQN